jgi:transcriptional regulator with XRE-family HTH domain
MTVSAFRNSVSRREQWLARFGTAVRYARVEASWSQAELAEHVHVSRSNIANIEAGRQDIPSWKAAQLVALLHMELPGWTLEPDELGERLKAAEAESRRLRQALRTVRGVLDDVDPTVAM